jgi:prevent-host-death family protein
MLPQFHAITAQDFRENLSEQVRWVEDQGAHIWITKHGKHVAAVIPIPHLRMLEALLSGTLDDKRARLEQEYRAWKRAVALAGLTSEWKVGRGQQDGE